MSVISLDILHHLCGDVLHGQFGVVAEKLLAIHHNPFDGLAVVCDGAIFGYFHAWQLLYQFLQYGSFGHAEGIGIEHESVRLHLHLCQSGYDISLLHQLGIFCQGYVANVCLLGLLV